MSEPFRVDADGDPSEKRHLRYEVGETYLGDLVEAPITVINGERDDLGDWKAIGSATRRGILHRQHE